MAVAVGVGLAASGCHRGHYREQADVAAYAAVEGATANPQYQLAGYGIGVDPRSRLYDPTDPDCPPMPPDDPDSHRLMECVDGHRGWKHWERNGNLADVEVSDYRAWLPYDDEGRVKVDLGGVVELARLHSRDYQSQLETLYLSALDVTAERFRFQSQFFGGNLTEFSRVGSIRNGGDDSTTISSGTGLRMRRITTTGGTFVAGMANSIVWQLAGPDTNSYSSLLNFAISQPLLQFAGRPRVMETLTRSERNLLANVRQYDRFRQGFYLDVATGSGGGGGLTRAGGLFGGSGLSGFTGVGFGGFGGVGAVGVTSSGGFAGGGGVGANGAGGFLGFLQQQQFIRNQRTRIAALRDTWLQLDAAFDAGRLENRFQVDFARQAYYSGQSELLNVVAAYESALDLFKIRIGLPPDIPFELKDPFFDQFNLIDSELTQLQNEVAERFEALAAARADGRGVASVKVVPDLSSRLLQMKDVLTNDLQIVETNLPQRRRILEELSQRTELYENNFDSRAISPAALDDRVSLLRTDRVRLANEVTEQAALVEQLLRDADLEPVERIRAEREALSRVSASLLEVSLWQARTRLHAVTLVSVRVTPETAFQVALARRPDWMNAKASLVDTWRLIEFNANALKSNLSVNVTGDVGTKGNNPLNFDDANGTLRAGVQFDAPLTRLIERNQYRQSLIDYQQARRSLMAQRDEIHRGLRARLRQIHLDQFNLELRRLAVDVAITQTDIARLKLAEPEKPVGDGKAAAPSASPTVARDLVDALLNLQQSQATFISVWGDYEIQRRLLDFDLGTMSLDERGLWTDPGSVTDETLLARYYESLPNPLMNSPAVKGDPDQPGFMAVPGSMSPDGMTATSGSSDSTGVSTLSVGELPPAPKSLDSNGSKVPVPSSPSVSPTRRE
ncbi:MAG: TolC family protein [Planctomycetales bacterium]|nr:TolC family protein [Planctomycetales bacterium]